MGTSKYSPEFRADAVALYHSSPSGTYASVARDLGVNHETPHVGAGCRAGRPARGGGGHRDGEGEPAAAGASEGTRARAGDPAEGREVFCGGDQLVRTRNLTTAGVDLAVVVLG
ncbi:transposase [Streptomyces mirabilis]|uniref:transposase n=1 Tax=Streptomyces mirabilis TaxID=68239 RepID=UPI0037D99A10